MPDAVNGDVGNIEIVSAQPQPQEEEKGAVRDTQRNGVAQPHGLHTEGEQNGGGEPPDACRQHDQRGHVQPRITVALELSVARFDDMPTRQ